MNERIRELAEQAKIEFTYDPTETPMRAFAECWEDDLEKFAELIVRECAMQVADVRIENDFEPVGDAVLVQALAGIKKYFGVEP